MWKYVLLFVVSLLSVGCSTFQTQSDSGSEIKATHRILTADWDSFFSEGDLQLTENGYKVFFPDSARGFVVWKSMGVQEKIAYLNNFANPLSLFLWKQSIEAGIVENMVRLKPDIHNDEIYEVLRELSESQLAHECVADGVAVDLCIFVLGINVSSAKKAAAMRMLLQYKNYKAHQEIVLDSFLFRRMIQPKTFHNTTIRRMK